MSNNARTKVLCRFLMVTSWSALIGGVEMGMWAVSARGIPVGVEAAWIKQDRVTAYGHADGRADWFSRKVWRSIAAGTGLAWVSCCPTVPAYWGGFELCLPRFNVLLTWQTERKAKDELAHKVASCSVCDLAFGQGHGGAPASGAGEATT
ncbi:hypothetical protein [Streptomyces sp. NPDC046685]|uniref:hypothetical protein n=1 Tax=Streptomyces sp. NPDC046685 TaxID=3157202 RepID=UPI00340C1C73